MNNQEAIAFAKAALTAWDLPECTPRLIKNRENAVFEIRAANGDRAALRLHRPGYQTDDAIRSELVWTQELDKAGMRLPRPIPSKSGDLISLVPEANRMASIVSWVDGVPLGDNGISADWSLDTQAQLFHAVGAELAVLHRLSDDLTLPSNFERVNLDIGGLLGDDPNWDRFWDNPALSANDKALLLQTREALINLLKANPSETANYGLIHADALSENVFTKDGSVTLIDFDDGVFGFRMYELGVTMSQVWDRPNAEELAAALIDGYGIPPDQATLLPAFTVIRTLASCGWVISRYDADDPVLLGYANRAIKVSTRFMTGKDVFGAD